MHCIPNDHPAFVYKAASLPARNRPPVPLDAVFIPTYRSVEGILERIDGLADAAEHVFLLPSGEALRSTGAVPDYGRNIRWLDGIDWETLQRWFLALRSSRNPSQEVSRAYDLPLKRNLALQIARTKGFERICLLDDDISVTHQQLLSAAAALTETHPMIGYHVVDFPDVSTTEHIHRLATGTPSETMPGGNCLFMLTPNVTGFFPYIYNEDWIFVLHNLYQRPGLAMGFVTQDAHCPWNDLTRCRFEEFGEVMITGMLQASGGPSSSELASHDYWDEILCTRIDWLTDLAADPRATTHLAAVRAALLVAESLDSADFVQFVTSLWQDNEENPCLTLPVNLS